jgi:ribosomal protein S21
MASIDRQQNESIDRMLSRFRRIMMRKGTLKQMRATMYFQKPVTKRKQKLRAIYREEKRREAERQTL